MAAAALGKLGRIDEAKDAVSAFLAHSPGITVATSVQQLPWNLPEHQEAFADGLRAAGMPDGGPTEADSTPPPLPDKPSIAVLPFDNLSGDPEQEYFSDGITEDIITALSRVRQFFVIARNTTFTYKGQAVDVQAVATDLGVRYVLEGSVRKAGNRVRITVQLIDGATGNHLWAERYDRELEDIFAVQDEITQTVVGAIEPQLKSAERERAKSKPSENLDAWDLYQRGMSCMYQPPSPEKKEETLTFFQNAIERDPNFSPPYAGIAHIMYRQIIQG